MLNTAMWDHRQRNPECQGNFGFDPTSSQQWGFGWRECVYCYQCQYKSPRFKLYKEIKSKKRGPKSATVNRGITVAMTQTPIATSSIRKICLGGNIPAPSASCLQENANKVNNIVVNENQKDMKRIRNELQEINKYRNRPANKINIQADGMYNNNLYGGVGRTPFQPATQATYTIAETITKKKQIIAAEAVNKLCSKHGFHTSSDDACDMKCAPCPATASIETTIGDEHRWARSCLEDLHEDGLEVSFLTTDADTGAYRAAVDLYNEKITTTEPCHQFDTRHLAENHRKQMRNCPRILSMMPGHDSAYRNYLRGRFSLDLSKRCTAEFDAFFLREHGDITKIIDKMKYCVNAIKRCYAGDHCGCKMHSLNCKGLPNNNWLLNSPFLTKNFRISLTKPENHDTMLDWIEFRLGEDMLMKTRLNSNTQKVEGTNRAIKRSLPKNVTFTRNFPGRLNSAIHSVNNGPGQSVIKLCRAADCPIPESGRVAAQLQTEQRKAETKQRREMTLNFKHKRRERRAIMYKLHEKTRETNKYMKSQLLKDRMAQLTKRRRQLQNLQKPTTPVPSTSDHEQYTRPFHAKRVTKQGGACRHGKT
ncbi:uncharacterized protein LOC123543910 [Mercenaria mercenaria]|uniref:uncharacterized protein LOC123543910 n=1 Tax=Mercenaria mercenaria TaxID=6596 RepID=UPI001E1D65B1|nr:uncharacterized protein LOC123543910 [Mercenaria mercenaria]